MAAANSFGCCPGCAERMRIASLRCWRCGTTVGGQMPIPLLARLSDEHGKFLEQFVLGNGSLAAVQKVFECSYPKVRRLLDDTIAALRAEIEADRREQDEILTALEEKRVDGDEAVRLVRSLVGPRPDTAPSE